MRVRPLLQKINPSTFIEDLLTAYGVESVETYLSPTADLLDSPWSYPNMSEAVDLLNEIVLNENSIGVLVDEDCDGFMSSGIMVQFLKSIGVNPTVIFHTDKAHGLSNDIFEYIKSLDLSLLIIPDAGSNDGKQCNELKILGTEVIILDHHEITKKNPQAIVVNHHLSPKLNQALSGTGVTYKFIQAYCDKFDIKCPNYMDMVAVSLVSDICDLTNMENRTYLEFGLNSENSIINPLLALMFRELAKDSSNPEDVSWSVAPKINAICRIGNQEYKEVFFNALIGEGDIEEGLDVAKKAHNLQTKTVKKIFEDLEPTLDLSHNVIIGYIDNENRNYSGLIANKIAGKYHRPSLVLRDANENQFSGSVRSPVDVASLVNGTGLASCQGHESACGILMLKTNIDKLIAWFDKQKLDDSVPLTAILTPKQATVKLARACGSYDHLWGHGVKEPLFYISSSIHGSNVIVYQKKTNTIKFNIDGMDFLKFKATDEEVETFTQNKLMDIEMVVKLEVNEWRGKVTVQGMIEDYEIYLRKPRMIGADEWKDLF